MKPYRSCSCRDPGTGRPYPRGQCPRLAKDRKHGGWYARYEAPGQGGKRRQPRIGPFATRKEAEDELVSVLGDVKGGKQPGDRQLTVAAWLTAWLAEAEPDLKPRTLASYRDAVKLYFAPGIGHMKLADLRDHHLRALYTAMRRINRPEAVGDRSELMRRLLAARARPPHVPDRAWSTRPLGEQTIRRHHAVISVALNDAVEAHKIPASPAATVFKRRKSRKSSGAKNGRVRPLLWSAPRVERWRETGQRPAKVMVWTSAQCGAFLDAIEHERLYFLYHLAAYWGLRRGELLGLEWADLDLDARRLTVRQAQDADGDLGSTKSEDSDRTITIDEDTARAGRAWRKAQLAERLAWGGAWADSGRVFTREDGSPLRGGYVSEHFAVLIGHACLPPVRFHDLRHGAATMLIAAGQPVKLVSEILGHATSSFTMDVYAVVAEELAESAAVAIAAFIPRKARAEGAR